MYVCFERLRTNSRMMNIRIKRAYEEPGGEDGTRILVDRLWPRGLTKEEASVDLWLKDVAPSTELRKWFAHDPTKWAEFRSRYHEELKKNKEQALALKTRGGERDCYVNLWRQRSAAHE